MLGKYIFKVVKSSWLSPLSLYNDLLCVFFTIFSLKSIFSDITFLLVAQMVKYLPTLWETWVQSLGLGDLLEKEMAIHSSSLAWKIPWSEEPGRLHSPWGHKESDMTERLHFHFFWHKYNNYCIWGGGGFRLLEISFFIPSLSVCLCLKSKVSLL